jgi:uncharacterized protein (TIGR03086 family)
MSEIADRYRKVAQAFTDRANGVPEGAWDNPAPCEGWVARDIVRHMAEWFPSMFLDPVGITVPAEPTADADPAGAWNALNSTILRALHDPATASQTFEMRMGTFTVEQAVGMFATGDVLVHTWDLARATGLDETLDPDEVHVLLAGMTEMDEDLLRNSGHYGPRVEVPDDADEQTKLIAYTGRTP